MTEKCVLGKATVGGELESIDVVNALSGEASLRKQILIHVRHGRRIRIYTRVTGVNRSEMRRMRTRQRYSDPRLKNPVSAHDPAEVRVVVRLVERMCHRADEHLRRIARKHRVR